VSSVNILRVIQRSGRDTCGDVSMPSYMNSRSYCRRLLETCFVFCSVTCTHCLICLGMWPQRTYIVWFYQYIIRGFNTIQH